MGMHDAAVRTPDTMALFLDVDGTLIEFADRPDAVSVPPDLPAALLAVAQRLDGALALVSGRSIAELDQLFAPVRLPASGLHGAEMRLDADGVKSTAIQLPAEVAATLRRELAAFAGVTLEDKGASVAVHYRASPGSAVQVYDMLARFVARTATPRLDLMVGELVYELKPFGFDKGSAIAQFMQHAPFAGRKPVFVADHPIDQAAFSAVSRLGGMGLSVGRLLPGATGWFSDPAAVRRWLRGIAEPVT
jgi:trehalose 6-phosphate phosphatase